MILGFDDYDLWNTDTGVSGEREALSEFQVAVAVDSRPYRLVSIARRCLVGVVVEYVMVPVPEELASRVLWYVSWKGQPRSGGAPERENDSPGTSPNALDNGDPIARAFGRLDDAGRALAGVIALAALDEEPLSVSDAARRARVSAREAVGIMVELGNMIVGEGGQPFAVFVRDGEGATAEEFSWDTHVVVMQEAVARPLAELARTHGFD
jgi:hypothetical protein